MGAFAVPGFSSGNNAPLPVPGGYGNPTGANFGTGKSTSTPAFPVYNTGSFTGTNIGGLSSGLSTGSNQPYNQDFYNMLGKAYGKGTGQLLGDLLSKGLFNPQIAAAFLNAQQPGIARGQNDILSAFGDAGARFGSASALGLGDYQSQVQLNQQATLAQLFQGAQQDELALLSSILPTVHQERANAGSTLSKILGGLEAVGGIAAAPFTGGASLALTGSGIGMLTGQGGGGGGTTQSNPFGSLASLFGNNSGKASQNSMEIPSFTNLPSSSFQPFPSDVFNYSAGSVFGPMSGGSYDTAFPTDNMSA